MTLHYVNVSVISFESFNYSLLYMWSTDFNPRVNKYFFNIVSHVYLCSQRVLTIAICGMFVTFPMREDVYTAENVYSPRTIVHFTFNNKICCRLININIGDTAMGYARTRDLA